MRPAAAKTDIVSATFRNELDPGFRTIG